MSEIKMMPAVLKQIPIAELWIEIARRFNVNFGKIQMTFHDGKPSRYAMIGSSVPNEENNKSK